MVLPRRERVRGVPELAARAAADLDLHQGPVVYVHLGRVPECRHKLLVHLQRGPVRRGAAADGLAGEDGEVVAGEGDVLPAGVHPTIAVEELGDGVFQVGYPVRDRDVNSVADVAAAPVEGHDGLDLEAEFSAPVEQLNVGREVVYPWRLLAQAPPHVDHDTLCSNLLDTRQASHCLLTESVVFQDSVERHHHEHRHRGCDFPPV
mmetsp:Transcript_33634/g.82003  ORF Transcript_33634/g.82003 Transcript_33634/m.82003 type:complete len:205 (+) Transcript_33634:937-1551(+)